jgi:hypothetical protein
MATVVKDKDGKPCTIILTPNDTYVWAVNKFKGNWVTREVACKRVAIHLSPEGFLTKVELNGIEQKSMPKDLSKDILALKDEALRGIKE